VNVPEKRVKMRRNSLKDLSDAFIPKSLTNIRGSFAMGDGGSKIGKYLMIYVKDILFTHYAKILHYQLTKRQALHEFLQIAYHKNYMIEEIEPCLFAREDNASRIIEEVEKQREEYYLMKHPSRLKSQSKKGQSFFRLPSSSNKSQRSMKNPHTSSRRLDRGERGYVIQSTATTTEVDCCACMPLWSNHHKIHNSIEEEEEIRRQEEKEIYNLTLRKHNSPSSTNSTSFQRALHYLNFTFPALYKARQEQFHRIQSTRSLSSNYRNLFHIIVKANYSFHGLIRRAKAVARQRRRLRARPQPSHTRVHRDNHYTPTATTSRQLYSNSLTYEESENSLLSTFEEGREEGGYGRVVPYDEGSLGSHTSDSYDHFIEEEEENEDEDEEHDEEMGEEDLFVTIVNELTNLEQQRFISNVYEKTLQYLPPHHLVAYEERIDTSNRQIQYHYEMIEKIHEDLRRGKVMSLLRQLMPATDPNSVTGTSSKIKKPLQPVTSWITGEYLTNSTMNNRSTHADLTANRTRRASIMKEEAVSMKTTVATSSKKNELTEEDKEGQKEGDQNNWMIRHFEKQKELIIHHNAHITSSFYQYFLQLASTLVSQDRVQHSSLSTSCCEELLVLGGQRRVIQLMRIVEHSDINPRGIIVIEEFSANILSRVKMNADYHQVFALHLTTNNASSIIGGEGSASLIQPPPSISAFSARLNPATFTVPIMSLIRQSSYKTSLWNLIYHSVRHSCSRLQ